MLPNVAVLPNRRPGIIHSPISRHLNSSSCLIKLPSSGPHPFDPGPYARLEQAARGGVRAEAAGRVHRARRGRRGHRVGRAASAAIQTSAGTARGGGGQGLSPTPFASVHLNLPTGAVSLSANYGAPDKRTCHTPIRSLSYHADTEFKQYVTVTTTQLSAKALAAGTSAGLARVRGQVDSSLRRIFRSGIDV
jgi:hypothetical protein